jgi:anti-sigma28 factor (negative regulator of flagellin synthesis)
MMVVDTAENTVRYSGEGYHRGVVVHCRPNVGLSFDGHYLHLSHLDCMRLEGLVDNGIEFLRAVAANASGKTASNAVTAANALNGDQHSFAFQVSAEGISSGSAEFSFEQYKAEWSVKIDRSKVEELRHEVLDGYFSSLGKFNQLTRENNREWELRVSENAIDFAYNFDVTGDPAVDCMTVPVNFAGNTNGASVKLRTKDFAATLYRVACLPLEGDLQMSGNMQAVVLHFSTHRGAYSVAIPTLIANDNCDLGISLFKTGN